MSVIKIVSDLSRQPSYLSLFDVLACLVHDSRRSDFNSQCRGILVRSGIRSSIDIQNVSKCKLESCRQVLETFSKADLHLAILSKTAFFLTATSGLPIVDEIS